MTPALLYGVTGALLSALGLLAAVIRPHLVQKILAVNVAGSGAFLIYVAIAYRGDAAPDPVPHAMVLTGIVVAVSTSALALRLTLLLRRDGGRPTLPDGGEGQ